MCGIVGFVDNKPKSKKEVMAFFEKYREDSMQLLGKLEKAKIRQLLWKIGFELVEDNG